MTETARDSFAGREYPVFNLAGTDYPVKPSSTFSFNDLSELGGIQDKATALLEEAREAGHLNEDGDIDTSNSTYALRIVEINLERLVIHLQHQVDVEYLKELGADEIQDFEDFLANEDDVRDESRKRNQDSMKSKKLIRDRKRGG